MSKIMLGLVLGAVLGLIDGLSAYAYPYEEVREQVVSIVLGSTFKGVLTGVIAGLVATRWRSLPLGIAAGFGVGLLLAYLVAAMPSETGVHYYWEIMLPGAILGAIVGRRRFPLGSHHSLIGWSRRCPSRLPRNQGKDRGRVFT